MKYEENDSLQKWNHHMHSVYPTNKNTFLNSSGETVSQQPSGNDNLCTGNFYVFSALLVLMFMKNACDCFIGKLLTDKPRSWLFLGFHINPNFMPTYR